MFNKIIYKVSVAEMNTIYLVQLWQTLKNIGFKPLITQTLGLPGLPLLAVLRFYAVVYNGQPISGNESGALSGLASAALGVWQKEKSNRVMPSLSAHLLLFCRFFYLNTPRAVGNKKKAETSL